MHSKRWIDAVGGIRAQLGSGWLAGYLKVSNWHQFSINCANKEVVNYAMRARMLIGKRDVSSTTLAHYVQAHGSSAQTHSIGAYCTHAKADKLIAIYKIYVQIYVAPPTRTASNIVRTCWIRACVHALLYAQHLRTHILHVGKRSPNPCTKTVCTYVITLAMHGAYPIHCARLCGCANTHPHPNGSEQRERLAYEHPLYANHLPAVSLALGRQTRARLRYCVNAQRTQMKRERESCTALAETGRESLFMMPIN